MIANPFERIRETIYEAASERLAKFRQWLSAQIAEQKFLPATSADTFAEAVQLHR